MTISFANYQTFVEKGNFTESERDRKFLGGMGLAGESGEVLELFKKHLLHGKPLDMEKLVEEMGDVLWYFTMVCNTYGISITEIMEGNVVKLCDRYPDGYGPAENWLTQ